MRLPCLDNLLVGAALLAALLSTGCYSLSGDCELNYNCGEGGTGGAGGTTTTGGAPPSCVPSNNSTPVADSCGVFVSSSKGEDTNAGTKDKPFATLAMAFNAAAGKPIYVCGEDLIESVEITGDTTLFGALDCESAWKYDASKPTVVNASSDMIALRVGAKSKADVFDLVFRTEDAQIPGGSSIAVVAEGESELHLTRSRVEPGDGKAGADGTAFVDPSVSGQAGADGLNACTSSLVTTPPGPTTTCGDLESVGGFGGNGGASQGGAGAPGLPDGAMNAGAGEGAAVCTAGTAGDDGAIGTAGAGAQSLGALQAGQGFVSAPGADGKAGAPGQGGGGGGGAKGGTGAGKCPAGMTGGASGGTGGSGGCGGQGGKGGKGGGASIGILSLGATLVFNDVTIAAQAGGKGGNGGPGQLGGDGGLGGNGGSKINFSALNNACAGGPGGKGGDGGKGGGGRGGHSLGIAHTGAAPDITGATITVGTPGNGGTGEGDPGTGAPGVAKEIQSF
ncbi:MAG: PGRS family protein [Polyangiaceae bacterium]